LNNSSNNNRLEIIDIISLVGFIISWLNYIENVDQSTMQDAIQSAVKDIHEHLESQDEKIDKIIGMLGGES
jgi:hypothetical protein